MEIGQEKLFFYLPANIFECVSEYMPFVSEKVITNTDANKKAKETKETKEEKEIENVVAINSIQREI